ncbi:MAG: translationally controlled tumor protein [Benniella sp.]|nr:MAG: translationally controlled tumor protein [Benniella sp.]
MIIYTDIVTGDELFSDAFDIKEKGAVYEIDGKSIVVKKGVDVDIGANASAEGGDDEGALEEGSEQVIDVVYSGRLQQVSYDKTSYQKYMKGYMKKLATALNLDEEADKKFKSEVAADFKRIVAGFKDYEFYTGESLDPEGALMLLNYREDGVTPFFTVFKHGLKERKV